MSNPKLTVTVKGINDNPDVVKLVTLMLNTFGIVGDVTIRVGYEIRGSGETRGIQIKQASVSGVVAAVQTGNNGSRRECVLIWHGQSQKRLHQILIENLKGKKYFRSEDYDRKPAPTTAVIHPFPVAAVAKPAIAVSEPVAATVPAPEEESSGESLRGFTGGDGTNVRLLLGEIREKHGSGEITTDRFYSVMRTSGLCGSETSNNSLGQIIRWLCEEGYFEHRNSRSVDYYRISARGDELLVETMRGTKVASVTPATTPHLIDAKKIEAGIAKLMDDIKRIDDADRELASLRPLIQACDDSIAELKKQIDPIIARRDELAEQAKKLEGILTNPQFMAAREKLRAFEDVLGQLIA